jgi:hypothetical protein
LLAADGRDIVQKLVQHVPALQPLEEVAPRHAVPTKTGSPLTIAGWLCTMLNRFMRIPGT